MKYKALILGISLILMILSIKAQTTLTLAEDFSMKSTYGQTYQLFPYLDEGKIVVLTFFTTT